MATASARPTRPNAGPGSGGSRSFSGCHTCRKRHVKCDERLPTCRQCRRAGLTCGGYVKNIIFDFELRHHAKNSSGPTHFRRPFFTEHERNCMSQWLISAVAPSATTKILRLLDEDIEAMVEEGSRNIIECNRGPFGAFSALGQVGNMVSLSPGLTQHCPAQSLDDSSNLARLDQALEQELDAVGLEQSQDPWDVLPWPHCEAAHSVADREDIDSFQVASADLDLEEEVSPDDSSLGECLQHTAADMSGLFCDEMAPDSASVPDIMARVPSIFDNNFWEANLAAKESFLSSSELPLTQEYLFPTVAIGVPPSNPDFMNTQQDPLLVQAIPLLKHYGSSVIASMSPFRHNDTPWHIIFLAQLKTCLASLTLREALDEAGLTTFYGSLAISALSLGMTSQSQMWLDYATQYQRQAYTYARVVLTKLCIELDADEYKLALIALLTMAQMSLFAGKQDQTEGFLLETEKLVRIRGLSKKKSRKMRLLHHCYVHMRLFHESTFMASGCIESSHRREVRHAVESSGLSSSTDNLSFRLLHWNDLSREMTVMKSQIEGENDLHIARPGLFPSTMYPEIFGIPEPFFFFWSQIIRLGNEKDIAEQGRAVEPTPLRDFSRRAKALEKGINQLQSKTLIRQQDESLVLTSLLDGMQSALRIYFYRRVYDVSSSMLQPIVVSVRNWLFDYDQANPDFLHGSFGLMWPAFIAACEAEDEDLQSSFRQWFRNAARRSGLGCISENAKFIERVWKARRTDANDEISWLDIIGKERPQSEEAGIFMAA